MARPSHVRDEHSIIRKLCVGSYETNAYVVECASTGKGVLIDAGAEPDVLLDDVADIDLVAILATHGHADHVEAVDVVREATGAPFLIHPADAGLAGVEPDAPLEGPIEVGALTVETLHTPGHTPGSSCLSMPGLVFTGDTLFPGGPGATTDASADFERIVSSIEQRLFTMEDDTLVMPGHGLDTTIGTERPQLAAWVARGW